MAIEDYGSRFAADARSLDDLRTKARNNPREGLKAAAQQFEAYFMQMMLKSMRETLSQDGLFDNDQTRFYTGMLDEQMGQQFGAKGSLGFSRMLEAQLGQSLPETSAGSDLDKMPQRPVAPAVERILNEWRAQASGDGSAAMLGHNLFGSSPADRPPHNLSHRDFLRAQKNQSDAALGALALAAAARRAGSAGGASAASLGAKGDAATPREFVAGVWPHAVEASATTGVAPHLLVAHAALESAWGQSVPLRADGSSSHNLFGVKAGKAWAGATAEAVTTEYEQGQPVRRSERFRAYGSVAEAFADYAKLLSSAPRYSGVVSSTSGTDFANSLQQSGYATDPMYAAKLDRIINGKTLRDALLG